MNTEKRSAFQQQVVEELIKSKAIDLAAIGSTVSKLGERAIRDGESLVAIINRHAIWACGWPGPEIDIGRQVQGQLNR